jgi:hypothetical protein
MAALATAPQQPRTWPSTSSSSYLARSRRTVRMRMTATMMLMTSTTSSELRMENQCTLPLGEERYASQRDAHSMSLTSQCTSYLHGRKRSAARTHSRACLARHGGLAWI